MLAKTGPAFTSKENFSQWYRDVDGLNQSEPISTTLEREGDLYVYNDNRFFPIDGELLGGAAGSRPAAPASTSASSTA